MESLAHIFELNINGTIIDNEILGFNIESVNDYNNVSNSIDSAEIGNVGTKFLHKKVDASSVEINFSIVCATNSLLQDGINDLKGYLNANDIKFSYYKTPTYYQIGNLDSIQIEEWQSDFPARFGCNGKISIRVDRPIKYSTTTKEFTANSSGLVQITNNGNIPCNIDYEIEMLSDNGYIGIRGQRDEEVMEYGSSQEIDGEYISLSTNRTIDATTGNYLTGIDPFFWSINSGFSAKSYAAANVRVFGQVDYDQGTAPYRVEHHGYMLPTTFSPTETDNAVRYRGLRKRIAVSNNSKDFTVNFEPYFEASAANEAGLITFGIYDTTGKAICGCSIVKGSVVNSKGNLRFYIATIDEKGSLVKDYDIECVDNASFGNNANSKISISKLGDSVIFNAYKIGRITTKDIVNPNLPDMQIRYIQIGIYDAYLPTSSSVQKAPSINKAYVNITTTADGTYDLNYTNENVETYNDLPNRYSAGETILISGTDKTIYKDGLEILEDEIIGTNYFEAPIGISNVQLIFSDFATMPNVKAIIRECNI